MTTPARTPHHSPGSSTIPLTDNRSLPGRPLVLGLLLALTALALPAPALAGREAGPEEADSGVVAAAAEAPQSKGLGPGLATGIFLVSVGAMLSASGNHWTHRYRKPLMKEIAAQEAILAACAGTGLIFKYTDAARSVAEPVDRAELAEQELEQELQQINAAHDARITSCKDFIDRLVKGGLS